MLINAPVQKYVSDVLLGLQQVEMTFQPQRSEDVKNEEQFILLIFHIFCSLRPSQVLYSFHVHGFVLHAPQQQHMDAMVDMISLGH